MKNRQHEKRTKRSRGYRKEVIKTKKRWQKCKKISKKQIQITILFELRISSRHLQQPVSRASKFTKKKKGKRKKKKI